MKRSTLFFVCCLTFTAAAAVATVAPLPLAYFGVGFLVATIAIPFLWGTPRAYAWIVWSACAGVLRVSLHIPDMGLSWMWTWAETVRAWGSDVIGNALPQPQAGLVSGILLGGSHELSRGAREWFMRTGTSHLMAASGSNVSAVIVGISAALAQAGISRKKSNVALALGVAAFVAITGAPASVVRAALFSGVILLGQWVGRKKSVRNGLMFIAAVMALIEPRIVLFDLGFQLSFLAALGVMFVQPVLVRALHTERISKKWLRMAVDDFFLMTMAAIIMTQPLLLYRFGGASVVAPLANILVLPAVPLVMLLGFPVLGAGIFSAHAAAVVGWAAWVPLSYILTVARWCSGFSWAYREGWNVSFVSMVVLYVAIAGVLWWIQYTYRNDAAEKN